MFGIFLWIVFFIGVIGLIGLGVWDSKGSNPKYDGLWAFIGVISGLLVVFSIVSALIYNSNIVSYTSPENYYETLLQKQEIINKLEIYDEEIHNVLSGDVAIIDFTKQEELIGLNSQIEKYNYKIIKHQKFKESFWFSKLYNKNVANLELFSPIFNMTEE